MIRQLRLSSGLVMLAYVTMHLLNHAVGLVSLEAMEDVLWYVFRIWTNRPAQVLLYGSFLIHYGLALWALWQRRSLRLRASEFSRDRIDDLRVHLKEGDKVHAMIINVDRKNRSINLSVKAKDAAEETEAMKQLRTENAAASAGATNLGALLRAKLDKGGGNPQQ